MTAPATGTTASGAVREDTIVAALAAEAKGGRGMAVFHLEEGPVTLTTRELVAAADAGASVLRAWGVRAGDRVGILGPNRPGWLIGAMAAWTAGAVVVPLPFHLRARDRVALAERTTELAGATGCRLVLTDPGWLADLPGGLARSWDLEGAAGGPGTARCAPDPIPRAEDVAVVQLTSGSTAAPRAATLTHGTIMTALRATCSVMDVRGDDRWLAWLPFFHDWGLFGYLLRPLLFGNEAHLLPTERFAADPARWLRLVGEVGATRTASPPSAVPAALRAAARDPDGIDLSTLRALQLAAEMIDPEVVDGLLATGASWGLRAHAVSGAYGMAEATLPVSISEPGEGMVFDEVDPERLAAGHAVLVAAGSGRRIAGCGRPLPGLEVRIAGDDGPMPERRLGEIRLRGPSLMQGYLPPARQPFDADGWLQTGDLGYLADGRVYVVGRIKDLIVYHGQNHAPEELEWAAGRVPGVRAGRVIAFARPGGREGETVIGLELEQDADASTIPALVRRAVAASIGVPAAEVLILPPGGIPKTTSGKLRRGALREAYANGAIPASTPVPSPTG